jgi:hypothetical protein
MTAVQTSDAPMRRWRRLLAALEDVAAFTAADERAQTALLRAESSRYLLRVLDNMVLTGVEVADPAYPRLVRLFDTYRQFGNANPDCVYFYCRVSPEHTYRIYGNRGTARLLEVQTMDGHILAGPNHKGLVTLSDLEGDAEGNIEIWLSAEPQPGHWLKLEPDARWLYLRQYYYDWETERPADLAIERVGASYPPPVLTPEALARRVDQIVEWIPTWYRHLANMAASYYSAPPGAMSFVLSKSGMAGLYYGKGHFAFGSGEGILVEFKPPPARYWSFQVMNHFWESLEWDVRQTSLNGHQAHLDDDGVFRAVIADVDPGIANWLDTCGHRTGLICGRVLRPEEPPQASLRVIKLSDLDRHLPKATRRVSRAERSETLRRRMLSVVRRYRE